jgi:hypothetical protein
MACNQLQCCRRFVVSGRSLDHWFMEMCCFMELCLDLDLWWQGDWIECSRHNFEELRRIPKSLDVPVAIVGHC